MIEKQEQTYWARIYMSGPIEVAKQTIRAECLREGLCVTVEPTTFIYTGGEEAGYVVGLIQYPRFPSHPVAIEDRARDLMEKLLDATHQQSALLMTPNVTTWITKREDGSAVPCGVSASDSALLPPQGTDASSPSKEKQ
jgi:hypothetical protein